MTTVICVVSQTTNKGKTTLIKRLITRFSREGFKVATVKHIHGLFDTSEKDTWKHLEAGAAITVASTPTEIVTLRKSTKPSLEETLTAIDVNPDLVLVEGYKKSSAPKILCTDTASNAKVALKEIQNIIMVSGSITQKADERKKLRAEFPGIEISDLEEIVLTIKTKLVKEVLTSLPGLDCGNCGYDHCQGLAEAIIKRESALKDCEVMGTEIASLKVDGRNVPMGKFPQRILRGVIMGIMDSLKGVEHPRRIEIRVRV